MINNANMNKAMVEMQRIAAQAQMKPSEPQKEVTPGSPQNFTELFQQAVSNVNEVQQQSSALKKSFDLGDPSVDLPQVMMASQKASVAFESMVQVRNKLLQAYKDVMSMPV